MRFLIVDTCYPAFLEAHYAERPTLAEERYDVQWRALMDRFFGTADAYSHFLGGLGHDAHEVVVNCEPLQQAWRRERCIKPPGRFSPKSSVVLDQAEELSPDVVYVQDLGALEPKVLRKLRKLSRLLVGQIASEAPPARQLAPFQLLLTSFPHFVPRFRELGISSEYFRLGFDPRVLDHVASEPTRTDVAFVGALGRSQHRGNETLERAAQRVPIDFWGYNVDAWPRDAAIRRRYHGESWGIDMYRVLARSKIALNRHIDVAQDYANNMRLYEATGVGSLLITDAKQNLGDLYEPGKEIVTYTSEDDLVKMIRRYLAEDDERTTIARAGQVRTLCDHTYGVRMRELVEILSRYLP